MKLRWLHLGLIVTLTVTLPGLRLTHNVIAPLVLLPSMLILIASGSAIAWARLPRPTAVGVVAVVSAGSLFLIATAIGLGP